MAEPFFPVTSTDGTRIEGIETGAGRPIVAVHGGMSAGKNWEPIGKLIAGYRTLALDRRLYNLRQEQKSPHSFAREAEDIAAVVDKAGGKVLLVGHSSGAVASLEAALTLGDRLAGLAIYEPPVQVPGTPIGTPEAQAAAEAALAAGDAKTALRIFFDKFVGFAPAQTAGIVDAPWFPAAMGPLAGAQLQDNRAIMALGFDIDRYRGLKLPVLLLAGTTSPAHLRGRLDALAGVIPDTRLIELQGQGHNAAPDVLAAALRRFAGGLSWD